MLSVPALNFIYMFHFRMTLFLFHDPLGVRCVALQLAPGSFLESARQGGRERHSSDGFGSSPIAVAPEFDGGCWTVLLQPPGSPHQMESALPFTPGLQGFFLLVMSPWRLQD